MKRIGVKEENCVGCGLCEVHCAVAHSKSRGIVAALLFEKPRALPRVRVERRGAEFVPLQCLQCEEPSCVYYCLSGALQRNPVTRNIELDSEKCIGCWTCVLACPYGAIQPDFERGVASKCDLCPQLDLPACVANCPNEALVLVEEGFVEEPEMAKVTL